MYQQLFPRFYDSENEYQNLVKVLTNAESYAPFAAVLKGISDFAANSKQLNHYGTLVALVDAFLSTKIKPCLVFGSYKCITDVLSLLKAPKSVLQLFYGFEERQIDFPLPCPQSAGICKKSFEFVKTFGVKSTFLQGILQFIYLCTNGSDIIDGALDALFKHTSSIYLRINQRLASGLELSDDYLTAYNIVQEEYPFGDDKMPEKNFPIKLYEWSIIVAVCFPFDQESRANIGKILHKKNECAKKWFGEKLAGRHMSKNPFVLFFRNLLNIDGGIIIKSPFEDFMKPFDVVTMYHKITALVKGKLSDERKVARQVFSSLAMIRECYFATDCELSQEFCEQEYVLFLAVARLALGVELNTNPKIIFSQALKGALEVAKEREEVEREKLLEELDQKEKSFNDLHTDFPHLPQVLLSIFGTMPAGLPFLEKLRLMSLPLLEYVLKASEPVAHAAPVPVVSNKRPAEPVAESLSKRLNKSQQEIRFKGNEETIIIQTALGFADAAVGEFKDNQYFLAWQQKDPLPLYIIRGNLTYQGCVLSGDKKRYFPPLNAMGGKNTYRALAFGCVPVYISFVSNNVQVYFGPANFYKNLLVGSQLTVAIQAFLSAEPDLTEFTAICVTPSKNAYYKEEMLALAVSVFMKRRLVYFNTDGSCKFTDINEQTMTDLRIYVVKEMRGFLDSYCDFIVDAPSDTFLQMAQLLLFNTTSSYVPFLKTLLAHIIEQRSVYEQKFFVEERLKSITCKVQAACVNISDYVKTLPLTLEMRATADALVNGLQNAVSEETTQGPLLLSLGEGEEEEVEEEVEEEEGEEDEGEEEEAEDDNPKLDYSDSV